MTLLACVASGSRTYALIACVSAFMLRSGTDDLNVKKLPQPQSGECIFDQEGIPGLMLVRHWFAIRSLTYCDVQVLTRSWRLIPKAYQNANLGILISGGLWLITALTWLITALTHMFDTQRWANAIVNLN